MLIIAADTDPFDVVSYMPGYAESLNVPYYFVRSNKMLAKASGNKNSATIVLL